ncbi:hypothetical protein [Pseudomonas aeruginosa]|uniref:hypothetical protein n=1 Tax=Pseudomonas aeruginosa TaxID=287 RepID=UPI000F625DA1|nr:hypothetical protein [Pseudomonas aeruginosa]RRH85417.1 hypothetical protein EIM22_03700 [Pseudomonas aeruginosa]HCW1033984.1 hypothetical protein [Pseudomonas aeruginosa]HCW1045677.1 hypothetical protein [Pseudomonas aeruginosa]HDY5503639.1 hypothetical protein [Pseudomonas aeruginosa]
MKKKQSRSDWLQKDPSILEWLKKTAPQWARDNHGALIYLNMLNEDDFKKIKQRWNSRLHRAKRKSLSCDISPATFSTLKRIQGKRGLTETLEEIININHEANKHYAHIFEEKLKIIKSKRDIGISREINLFSSNLEKTEAHRKKLSELKNKIEEQEGQIAALRQITIILKEKLLSEGLSLDPNTTEQLRETLYPSTLDN